MKKATILILLVALSLALKIERDKSLVFQNVTVLSDNFPLDADGTLIISHSRFRITGTADFNLYSVRGEFFSQTGDTSSKLSVGDIIINDSIYPLFSQDSTYKIYGMDFSTDTAFTWVFYPQGTNNITQVPSSFTTTKPLYNINNLNLAIIDTNVNRSLGFSYSHPVITADSIVYIFASDSLRIQKTVVNASTGVNFTVSEMQTLPNSDAGGFVIIVYNTMTANLNGKKYYFQNNSSAVVGTLHVY